MNKSECLLRWHGSKRALAPTIAKLFPAGYEKMLYVEPFCGAASVFWAKRPSRSEVLNDLNGELMNFLWTVKLHPRELARTLRLLPNSRALFATAMDTLAPMSSVLRAARFVYLSETSYGGLREHWAPQGRSKKGNQWPKLSALRTLPMKIYRWARRLSEACLECAPWQEVVEKYDSPQTLFYFDPPYLGTKPYHGTPFGEPDWRELRARLDRVHGKFVLSAEGTARMKLLWRGNKWRQRLTAVRSSLGPNDRRQKELLVWNY